MEKPILKPITAKTILSRITDDLYFGVGYNINLYRGCQHQCIYCDSRSTCYQVGDFRKIAYKRNSIDLLTIELRRKKKKSTIGFGSMNDPYMPVEKDRQLSRKALQVIAQYRFPVHIITKSDLIVRDIDLLQQISKIYAAVSFTITTADDELAKIIEPHAPLPSRRFEAIKEMTKSGIYCGITLMPLLPFINDNEDNIEQIVNRAHQVGAKYILPAFGVTLRDGSREYFYNALDKSFPGVKQKYEQQFGLRYQCNSPKAKSLYSRFYKHTSALHIPAKMVFYEDKSDTQLSLF